MRAAYHSKDTGVDVAVQPAVAHVPAPEEGVGVAAGHIPPPKET